MEAYVRISRGLLLCYRQSAEVPVQGLREDLEGQWLIPMGDTRH